MADYSWLTITYPSGWVVTTPHRGHRVASKLSRSLGALGARLDLGGPVQGRMAEALREIDEAQEERARLDWRAHLDCEGEDDD